MNNHQQESGWSKLWKQPKSKWLLGIPLGAFLAVAVGAVGTVGFNTVLHATSSDAFCVNCHVPSFAAEEVAMSKHGTSASGMVVNCADCHVSKEFVPKMIRKISAMKEVYLELKGEITTKDEFLAYKKDGAARIIAEMKANDSRECRTCHDVERMNFDKQKKVAAKMHQKMEKMGKTCIDCHKYKVAHKKP
ncbi:NapC/NirT family cytochrome c [Ferrimonas sp.]|uniref:NapC/NirT family cytochrome c n=1 Tax=Ferrimonas sp. TaxID=2080861 RepID=UPI003A8CD54C